MKVTKKKMEKKQVLLIDCENFNKMNEKGQKRTPRPQIFPLLVLKDVAVGPDFHMHYILIVSQASTLVELRQKSKNVSPTSAKCCV